MNRELSCPEVGDPEMKSLSAQWAESLHLGKDLGELVLDKKPQTAREEIETFVACLNLLLKQNAKFELADWRERQYGTHMAQAAIIKVMPPA
ncbi:hypothetical protein MYX78_00245 [Acidobacteria bacterium AH-259-G07]|nr:hypothetical protein [Acidobacteria bacterium AH-259-G07]